MDGGTFAACTSPYSPPSPLPDGPHVFEVRGQPPGGETGTDFRSFTVDTDPPSIAIQGPDGPVNDTRATVEFQSDEQGVEFSCGVDGGSRSPCASPWTTPDLPNGNHSVNVVARDPAGNETGGSRLVEIAAEPPETRIDAGPEGAIKTRRPSFGFSSTRARSRFECKLDGGDWAGCGASYTTPELSPGSHELFVRAIDAAGGTDPSPASRVFEVIDCKQEPVAFGPIEAEAECFVKRGTRWVADGPVKMNGITFNPIAGRTLSIDDTNRKLSLGEIQLRIGSMALYKGELEWTVPEGEKVTLARIDLSTFQRTDGVGVEDTESALDLQGDDSANLKGFELKGEAVLELEKGETVMTGTIELPNAFTDAEGRGLTGNVRVKADNKRGLRLDEVKVEAPTAFIGDLELRNLHMGFFAEGNNSSPSGCNNESPGLRWQGGADAIVLPTPDRLTIQDVEAGFADGRFDFARARWEAPTPEGSEIGGGVRLQKMSFSMCTGPPLKLEGRVGLTAMEDGGADPKLKVPDAGLIYTGSQRADGGEPEPWKLRAEAPEATLKTDNTYKFKDLFLQYASNGTTTFGGKVAFGIPVSGKVDLPAPLPAGDLQAAVSINATLKGFIEADRFNAEFEATGCFAGTFTVGAVPFTFDGICPKVEGVVSSRGIAACGQLELDGRKLGGIGAGYAYGQDLRFMAGACDISPWRVEQVGPSTAAAGGARTVGVQGSRGAIIAVRGADGAPRLTLRGPRGQVLRGPDASGAERSRRHVAFTNEAMRTTYVVIARPGRGRWTVRPESGSKVADVRTASVLAPPKVATKLTGKGRKRVLSYRVRPRAGQRVVFVERGEGVARRIASVRGGRGRKSFRAADGLGGVRRVFAVVEQDGVPRRSIPLDTFTAPPRERPGRPGKLTLRRQGARLTAKWNRARGAKRYGVTVTLSDGRRLFYVRNADQRTLAVPGGASAERATVRVVGLRSDNGAGAAAQARSVRGEGTARAR